MLGLIVGESSLPNYVINKLLKKNIEFLILDLTKSNIYKRYKNSYSLKITELGKAISILKKNNCKNVIFIGKVERPDISLLKFDTKALFYFPRLFSAFKKGDGNILKEIIKIFKENKLNVVNSMKFTPELIFKDKSINKVKINNNKTMRPYILAESNWKAIKETKIEMAILPWGATEAHNYHLPYATDNIESDLLAAESAKLAWEKGAKVIVLPTIPFGVNTGQSDIYLDINMNPSTQFAILNDIIEVLNRQGIYKLMIFNSHGGNDFKPIIRELGLKFPKMFICTSNWYQALDRNKYFENSGDHAEEMETSLMLYFKPELVLPIEKWGVGKEKMNKIINDTEGVLDDLAEKMEESGIKMTYHEVSQEEFDRLFPIEKCVNIKDIKNIEDFIDGNGNISFGVNN